MISNYFYHEILRKTIIAFGTLFNDIEIKHKEKSGGTYSIIKVPIAYGPTQKFLARLEQSPNLKKEIAITLPRMSFEMTGISYDVTRKVSTLQTFKSVNKDTGNIVKNYMPVPYNVGFRLSILSKLNEDALQIVEQILPYFQPQFTLTVDLVEELGEKRDIPMVLNAINMDDQYEGDFTTRRALIYTLQFSVKTYIFGPIADSTDGLIKKVQVDYYSSTDTQNARRQVRYVSTPIAKKDYNNDNSSTLIEDLSSQETLVGVTSTSLLSVGDRIIIDSEIMKIKSLTSDSIVVVRGYNNTIASTHTSGTSIDVLSEADNTSIVLGDDFGFSEETTFFQDSGDYSNTRKIDLI